MKVFFFCMLLGLTVARSQAQSLVLYEIRDGQVVFPRTSFLYEPNGDKKNVEIELQNDSRIHKKLPLPTQGSSIRVNTKKIQLNESVLTPLRPGTHFATYYIHVGDSIDNPKQCLNGYLETPAVLVDSLAIEYGEALTDLDFTHSPKAVKPIVENLDHIKIQIGYPPEAQKAGHSGTVVAKVLVDTDGTTLETFVIQSPSPFLSAVVGVQAKKLQFSPATDANGVPVKAWVNVPFRFSLVGR